MVDYILVGFGLAGLAFAEHLEEDQKSYVVFEDSSQKSSRVAGGLYNPVILKRFTLAWNAQIQLKKATDFYKRIETRLGKTFIKELSVLRRFNTIEEQNIWFEACDKPSLKQFLSSELVKNTCPVLDIPYQYGKVNHTGRVEIEELLSSYLQHISMYGDVRKESFDYKDVKLYKDYIEYKNIKARNLVFCEGFGVKSNPFFNYLPLVGNKGEYIVIKCPELNLNEAVKSSIFIIPLGKNLYKVGATYNNQDKSKEITISARKQLEEKLSKVLKVPYEVEDQVAGIRPTVKDRRPLVGTHPDSSRIHILNGMGSRGIIIAPTVALELYNQIENNIPISSEINITRFARNN